MPGYEGNVAELSTGNSFNTDTYQGQSLKLVLNGVGTDWAAVTKVEFVMTAVSQLGGYASNKNAPTDVGLDDYSFKKLQDLRTMEVTRTGPNSSPTDGGAAGWFGGQMQANQTWVHFYAKDYGASARAEARIYLGGAQPAYTIPLRVPTDTDGDGFADKWEIAMAERWQNQYGGVPLTAAQALLYYEPHTDPTQDAELLDPDGVPNTTRPLVAQKDTGDAHTIVEEYRGYILDGGGLDGAGANGHAGGHIRLDPARKEILVEVDRAAVLNNVPGGGALEANLKAILNGSSKVFSNAQRGAGIYMYYLFDQTDLNIPKNDVNEQGEIILKLGATRSAQLQSDFLHLLFFDEGISDAIGAGAATVDIGSLPPRILAHVGQQSPRLT
jgi:hypothetical protein